MIDTNFITEHTQSVKYVILFNFDKQLTQAIEYAGTTM